MTFYFGILSDIDSDVALASFILTILFLSSFNFCLGALEFSIRENPIYNQMLQKIYKELMCMGFVNFVVVLFTATNKNERINEWIDIIDFVGYMLFFVAIFFVVHSFYIMFTSLHASKKYAQQHSISLAETLQIYSNNKDNFFKNILFHLRYFPVSESLAIVEFKIIYALFRDTYWLPPKFDYGLYLSGCLERYSLQIINIGFTSWTMMVVLSVVNYLRLKFMGKYGFNCAGYHTDPDRVPSDDEAFDPSANPYDTVSQRCQTNHLQLFCLCGAAVFCYALILFLIGRLYVKRLLCRAGVAQTAVYAEFLMFEESLNLSEQMEDAQRNVEINLPAQSTTRASSRRRMSINTFRGQITTLRQESMQEDESQAVYKTLTKSLSTIIDNHVHLDRVHDFRIWLRLKITKCFRTDSHDKDSKYENQNFIFGRQASKVAAEANSLTRPSGVTRAPGGRRKSTVITLSGGPLGNSPTPHQQLQKQPSVVPTSTNTPSRIADQINHPVNAVGRKKRHSNPVLLENMAPGVKQSFSTIQQFKLQQEIKKSKTRKRSTMEDYKDTKNKMKLTEDFSDVYFFASPQHYFRAVEVAILLNSLYLSVWAVNFISVAEDEANNSVMWQLLMLIPLVVCIPLVGEIVKTASLLSAIAELEVDVIGSVLENMEDETVLLLELREKISCRLVHVNMQAEKKEIVHALFYEIDTDKSGFISRFEFRDMLRALHLHYSDLKFKKLFNVIDKDRSGSISEQELTDVVFPEEAHDDDFKNRSKIVNEHMEVHKEKKKLEEESKIILANKATSTKNWNRLSTLTRTLGQFKKKLDEPDELGSSVLLELGTVSADKAGDGYDSDSSSSENGSPHKKNLAKVVSYKDNNPKKQSDSFLVVVHSKEESESEDEEEEKNDCLGGRSHFSEQIPDGRSMDDVEEVVTGTAGGRGERDKSTRKRDVSSELPSQTETTSVCDF